MEKGTEKHERESAKKASSMISVRLSPDEARMLREAAAANGESVSEYVRRVALSARAESAARGTVLFDANRPPIVSAQQVSHSLSGTQTIAGSWIQNGLGGQ